MIQAARAGPQWLGGGGPFVVTTVRRRDLTHWRFEEDCHCRRTEGNNFKNLGKAVSAEESGHPGNRYNCRQLWRSSGDFEEPPRKSRYHQVQPLFWTAQNSGLYSKGGRVAWYSGSNEWIRRQLKAMGENLQQMTLILAILEKLPLTILIELRKQEPNMASWGTVSMVGVFQLRLCRYSFHTYNIIIQTRRTKNDKVLLLRTSQTWPHSRKFTYHGLAFLELSKLRLQMPSL